MSAEKSESTATFVLRVWMPDRPGALGALASRIGSVGGDVIGIDILERGAGRVIDEVIISLPDDNRVELLLNEIMQVDGVDIESIRPGEPVSFDPRVDALETAADLVGAATLEQAVSDLCSHSSRLARAAWCVVLREENAELVAQLGDIPNLEWLAAFVAGAKVAAQSTGDAGASPDVAYAALPNAQMSLVMGRQGESFHSRERQQVSALAKIVDLRFAR